MGILRKRLAGSQGRSLELAVACGVNPPNCACLAPDHLAITALDPNACSRMRVPGPSSGGTRTATLRLGPWTGATRPRPRMAHDRCGWQAGDADRAVWSTWSRGAVSHRVGPAIVEASAGLMALTGASRATGRRWRVTSMGSPRSTHPTSAFRFCGAHGHGHLTSASCSNSGSATPRWLGLKGL